MDATQINSVIDHLAEKLAIPVGKLMEIIPRLGLKNGYNLLVSLVVMAICIGLLIAFIYYGRESYVDFDEPGILIVISMLLIAIIGFTIYLLVILPDFLFWYSDPEAWSLDYILNHLR